MRLILFLLLLAGCSTSVDSETGANGKVRHTIKCTNVVQRCYDRASETCPDGYLVMNRVRGIEVDDDTHYTLKIRCRSGKVMF